VTFNLTFGVHYHYDTTRKGITVPVILSVNNQVVDLLAKVDTGADFCIFKREHGEALGLDIETGQAQKIATVSGAFLTFGHQLILSTFDLHLDVTVYFAADYNFPRNILGRRGWLDQLRLAIIDYDGMLYLAKYDEP
jgi:hypothetical protein